MAIVTNYLLLDTHCLKNIAIMTLSKHKGHTMKKSLVTLCILSVSLAFANQPTQPKSGKRQPPQEAITACEGKDDGSSCTVKTPRGHTLEGTCRTTPDKKYFACKPKNGPKPRSK